MGRGLQLSHRPSSRVSHADGRRDGHSGVALLLLGLHTTPPVAAVIDFEDDFAEEEAPQAASPLKAAGSALKSVGKQQEATAVEKTIVLEAAIGLDGQWNAVGSFQLMVAQHPITQTVRVTSPKVTRTVVDPAAAAALTAALEANAPYRVRVPTSVFGGSLGRWAMSSLPLRCLVHSDLQESFVLHLDDRGNIAALDYSTPSGECLVEEVLPPTKWVFKGAAYVRLPKDAPRLNPEYTTNYHDISGSERAGAKGGSVKGGSAVDSYAGGGEGRDPDGKRSAPPKSFFSKYWMYIVPIGLIALNSIINPEPEPKRKSQ